MVQQAFRRRVLLARVADHRGSRQLHEQVNTVESPPVAAALFEKDMLKSSFADAWGLVLPRRPPRRRSCIGCSSMSAPGRGSVLQKDRSQDMADMFSSSTLSGLCQQVFLTSFRRWLTVSLLTCMWGLVCGFSGAARGPLLNHRLEPCACRESGASKG